MLKRCNGMGMKSILHGISGKKVSSPHHFVIEGVLEKAYEVEKEIIDDLERLGYDDNAIFSIRLAMDEALINGLKHGNKNDPSRLLTIDYQSNDKHVTISVEDEGPGFDYNNIVDPTQGDYLKRPHGRGIFLIRKFMHKVFFNEKGNRISFVYERDKGPSESGEMQGLHWMLKKNLLILTIENQDEFPSTEHWKKRLDEFLDRKILSVVVDLGRLSHVNTTVLSFLVFTAQRTKECGGRGVLCGPQGRVLNVLKMTNLDRIIPIHPDLESAMRLVGGFSSAPHSGLDTQPGASV